MRVAIDARLEPGIRGGVEPALQGLAAGLSHLRVDDVFGFLVYDGCEAWLQPFINGPCRLLGCGPPPRGPRADALPAALRPLVPLAKRMRRLWQPLASEVENEPPAVIDFNADIVHLALQSGFRTARPSVFHPHDLQHVHFPGNFSADDLRKRTVAYRTLAAQATMVVALTDWGAKDIHAHLNVPREQIAVVPWAPPLAHTTVAYEEPVAAAAAVGLHGPYAIFPAQTWRHKNHRTLLEAWRRLPQLMSNPPMLACTGRLTAEGSALAAALPSLGLAERVIFTGHIPAPRLAGLLRGATLLVYPSLFEGWGLPLAEAFALGLPVACSEASCLPDVAGDAARLFDPADPADIAMAVAACLGDDVLRQTLVARGRTRAAAWSWEATAAAMHHVYRETLARSRRV